MAENSESKKEATGPVISGGHLVAKALKNEGVEVIWTLCGGHIIDIYDGCIDEGIKIIDVRHEQVAAHAADGYSRQSGKIGCVVTTAGPGTTNAMTGIANAFRAESPLLMIGGQGALSQHKMGSLQDLPHVDFMSPITKFAASVPHTERIADMVSMAFRESVNGAPGPSAGSQARRLSGIDQVDRRSCGYRAARRYSGQSRASGGAIRHPSLDQPRA
jgi:acetolactate synthase-1/2/3 large subunit